MAITTLPPSKGIFDSKIYKAAKGYVASGGNPLGAVAALTADSPGGNALALGDSVVGATVDPQKTSAIDAMKRRRSLLGPGEVK